MKVKLWSATVLCGLALALPVVGGGAAKGTKSLQGKWQTVGMKFQGKELPKAFLEKLNLIATYTGNEYTLEKGGEVDEKGTYKIDTSKKPATIDFMPTEGKDKGKKQSGIVKVEGDTMTIGLSAPDDDERPTSFDTKDNAKAMYFTLKRKAAK